MGKKIIRIACQGASSLPWQEIVPFQGELKDLHISEYEKFREMILELGFSEPISIWKHKEKFFILNGHQRLRVIQTMVEKEGYDCPPLPVNWVEADSLKQAKKKVLSLTSQYGRLTGDGLYEFTQEAGITKEEVGKFRFPEIKFEKWRDEFFDREEGDEEVSVESLPEVVPVACRPGDLFTLEGHTLLCGDSTDSQKIAQRFSEARFDLILTDPPYNLVEHRDLQVVTAVASQKAYQKMADDGWDKGFEVNKVFPTIERLAAEDCSVYIFTSQFLAGEIWAWMKKWTDCAEFAVWTKSNPMPSLMKRDWTSACELICYTKKGKHVFNFPSEGHAMNVWNFAKPMSGRIHPTQKPVKLLKHIIDHTTKKGQRVLDLFGGSGSTLLACELAERRCAMVEREPKYCDLILERFFLETKKDPVREDGVKWSKLREKILK